jgi:hypothetical protein
MKKLILAAIAASLWSLGYSQHTFLVEHFDYPANAPLQSHGWTAHSAGTNNPIQVVAPGLSWTQTAYLGSGIGNAAAVNNNGSDENRPLNPLDVDTGSIYVSFLAKVNGEVTSTNAGFFFHIGQYGDVTNPNFSSISTAFRGRIHKAPGSTADKFRFGLTFNAATAGAGDLTAAEYDTGVTYLLVLRYDFIPGTSNDSVSLFVFADGDHITTEPAVPTLGPFSGTAADMAAAQYVALRQYNGTQDITVDGIIIRDYWDLAIPPVAAEPISPPNGANLFINGPASNTAVVSWSAAQNIISTVTYSWEFDLSPLGTFNPPLLSLPADNGGLSTTLTLPFGVVDSILNALSVNPGDTVPGLWRIRATSGAVSLVSDTTFQINIIRGIISAPFAPFSLLTPPDQTTIVVSASSTQTADIAWKATTAGTVTISYTWHAVIAGGSFTNPLVSLLSDNQGADTTLTLPFPAIDGLLDSLGINQGDTVNLDWTVEAFADSSSRLADQTWAIQIIRENTISLSQISNYDRVVLFPNPASHTLRLTNLPLYLGDIVAVVSDQSGRKVLEQSIHNPSTANHTLDISSLRPGMYVLTLRNESGAAHFRFVVTSR